MIFPFLLWINICNARKYKNRISLPGGDNQETELVCNQGRTAAHACLLVNRRCAITFAIGSFRETIEYNTLYVSALELKAHLRPRENTML